MIGVQGFRGYVTSGSKLLVKAAKDERRKVFGFSA